MVVPLAVLGEWGQLAGKGALLNHHQEVEGKTEPSLLEWGLPGCRWRTQLIG